MTAEQNSEDNHGKRSRLLMGAMLVVVIACVGFGAYSFHAWRKAVAANPAIAQKDITQAVENIAITPNEAPEIATVKDASKLTSGALAKVAKNGDQLLIYSQANRIFVYRPSIHKLVDILSVQAPSTAVTAPATTPSTTQPTASQKK